MNYGPASPTYVVPLAGLAGGHCSDAVSPAGQLIGTRILGTGRALGSVVLSNVNLEAIVDTSDAWITERTGIKERHLLEAGRSTSDLAAEAGRAACAAAHIRPSELDCIIIGTVTPDMPLPSTAVRVQQKLGAGPCAAFDLSAACTGFLYGLATADALVKNRQFARVLVVGVEVLSRVLDWHDRDTCVLFGDGAGAVVLGPEMRPHQSCSRGIVSTHLMADGNGADSLLIPGGGSLNPTSARTVAENLHTVKMNGKVVFAQAVRCISASCRATLEANKLCADDVDLVIPHQANLRILESVAERCGLPLQKFYLNIDRYGNTSSASIPIALDEAVREGKITDGMTLLFTAFGAGFTWGSALVRW